MFSSGIPLSQQSISSNNMIHLAKQQQQQQQQHQQQSLDSVATVATSDWRMRERLKTVSVALVLCLNIGIDPPDVLKTHPCAKLECWIDPLSLPPPKALETIGKNLQQQYEVWQPRSRYKPLLDPSVEETKKTCLSLRKNAKDERILFHYNGHGVPKPTKGGEIWVFNKSYTQYLPCSVYDIQSWLGSPCIYVFDCSSAGNILHAFEKFAEQRDEEAAKNTDKSNSEPYVSMKECILLVACGANDTLPMNPDLPADLFTCCLTTPIEIALRWFVSQNPLLQNITTDMIMKIPGQLNDRRTPLGELNWIFTAITDTIAWNILPHDLFKKLFRQDLMVAALFRNFLLAERIMRYYHCSPASTPALPSTFQHPLWSAWDLAAEACLHQLPDLLKSPATVQYQHSSFFTEQLTAFEVWLSKGAIAKSHPEQLPIVLQVLLSQVHRLRALMLLSRFLDLGPWSVKRALSVGIFPYVLKLLQSPAAELKPVLVFIWAKILALDNSCQNDLLKDNGFTYFINILAAANSTSVSNMSEHRAMCTFILSVFCHNFRFGQESCLKNDLISTLALHVGDADPLLRQWVVICLAKSIENYQQGRDGCLKEGMHERLIELLGDMSSEVRAATMFAISNLVQQPHGESQSSPNNINRDGAATVVGTTTGGGSNNSSNNGASIKSSLAVENCICHAIIHGLSDASPIVRKELVILLSRIVYYNMDKALAAALSTISQDRNFAQFGINSKNTQPVIESSLLVCVYKSLMTLSVDPFPLIAGLASHVVDYITLKLLNSGQIKPASILQKPQQALALSSSNPGTSNPNPGNLTVNGFTTKRRLLSSSSNIELNRTSAGLGANRPLSTSVSSNASSSGAGASGNLKRTSSFVNALKGLQGLASLVAFPTSPGGTNTGVDNGAPFFGGEGASGVGGVPDKVAALEGDSMDGGVSNLAKLIQYHIQNEADGQPSVQLKSCFYDWSLDYFREPQMKVPDIDDPGSVQYNQKQWRHQQNEKYATNSVLRSQDSALFKFDSQVNFFHSDNNPGAHLYFHPFEPHLLGADNSNGVIVYNWEDGTKMNSFSNSNPPGTRITSLRFINENDVALVVTGSDEGMVRIYKNYNFPESWEIVSAWRAVNENIPVSPRADLITDWHEATGSLFAAGDLRMIRVWDIERELCVQDIGTKYQQAVTSLTIEKSEGNLLIGGYADGVMNLYDRRVPSRESLVRSFNEHSNRILRCQFQNDGLGQYHTLVSGSVFGDVRVWDIRFPNESVRVIESVPSGVFMTALAIHDDAPLFACGTNAEYIRIFNINGTNLNTIKYNDGFLGSRIGHVGSLAFHPYRDVLAAATTENASLSVFSSKR